MTTTQENPMNTYPSAANARHALAGSAVATLTHLARRGTVTTALAADHALFLGLVAGGYATAADESLESIRQAAGLVAGVRIPSGTYPIAYTITPEGRALLTA